MGRLVRLLFGEGERDVVVECRRCGTTLSSDDDECSACGGGATVTYEIG